MKSLDLNQFTAKELNDYIEKFKESQHIYQVRKSMGMSMKQFRLAIKKKIADYLNNK